MLTIIASMGYELAGLRREQGRAQRRDRIAGANGLGLAAAPLKVIGVGKERAQASLQSLMRSDSPKVREADEIQAWLLLGFAGAVDPSLKTGDLVISSKYHKASPGAGPDFLTPDKNLHNAAMALGTGNKRVSYLDSLTIDRVIGSPQDKQSIREHIAVVADGGINTLGSINMEDYWVAEAAQEAGVAVLSVRVILDTATQALPSYLPSLAGARWKSVLRLAATPWRVPALASLAFQMSQAQKALTGFAVGFVAAMGSMAFETKLGGEESPLTLAESEVGPVSGDLR